MAFFNSAFTNVTNSQQQADANLVYPPADINISEMVQQRQQRIINTNTNTNLNNEPNANLVTYKIPTLFTRLMAETLDAVYIQLFKIFIAILLANYTDLL